MLVPNRPFYEKGSFVVIAFITSYTTLWMICFFIFLFFSSLTEDNNENLLELICARLSSTRFDYQIIDFYAKVRCTLLACPAVLCREPSESRLSQIHRVCNKFKVQFQKCA
jgi:hypothetical protein